MLKYALAAATILFAGAAAPVPRTTMEEFHVLCGGAFEPAKVIERVDQEGWMRVPKFMFPPPPDNIDVTELHARMAGSDEHLAMVVVGAGTGNSSRMEYDVKFCAIARLPIDKAMPQAVRDWVGVEPYSSTPSMTMYTYTEKDGKRVAVRSPSRRTAVTALMVITDADTSMVMIMPMEPKK